MGITPTLQASGTNISDHGSFWKFSPTTPSVMVIQNDVAGSQSPYWHTSDDLIAHFNWSFDVAMVRSYVATTAHLAQIISTS